MIELAITMSLTATWRSAAELDVERRQLGDLVVAREDPAEPGFELVRRDRRQEAHRAEVDADDGRARAEGPPQGAKHRPVAAEHHDEVDLLEGGHRRIPLVLLSLVLRIEQLDAGFTGDALEALETLADHLGLPRVTTAAVRTGSADGVFDPVIELIGERRILAVDEVQEELPVSLRAGQPRVYDADRLGRPGESGLGDLAQDPAVNLRVSNDPALPDLLATRFELRLDEHERLPARARESKRGRQRGADADERDVARDEIGRERQGLELARVRALEHGDARVSAEASVQLAASDVERDHPRRAALEEHVGEPAG